MTADAPNHASPPVPALPYSPRRGGARSPWLVAGGVAAIVIGVAAVIARVTWGLGVLRTYSPSSNPHVPGTYAYLSLFFGGAFPVLAILRDALIALIALGGLALLRRSHWAWRTAVMYVAADLVNPLGAALVFTYGVARYGPALDTATSHVLYWPSFYVPVVAEGLFSLFVLVILTRREVRELFARWVSRGPDVQA